MLGTCLQNVREKGPLVHNITNYVTVNDVANVILACGASPIMSDEPQDVQDITAICGGLNINIGTLNVRTIEGMLAAGHKANELNHMVLLDPVGAGASSLRTNTAVNLMQEIKFDVIRGNISEIKTLAAGSGTTKGVDADVADAVTEENLDEAVAFAKAFSEKSGSIVAITGAIDLVSDGRKCYGMKVVTLSDSNGWIYDPNGIDLDLVKQIKEVRRGRIKEYAEAKPGVEYHEGKGVWSVKCDIALPCATQNELDLEDAKQLKANGCFLVAEGANMPSTREATDFFLESGMMFMPGKAANAGGVATSALEMSQNSERLSWTFEEVDEKLHNIMINIFKKVDEAAKKYGYEGNYVMGANIAGFEKVVEAMNAQGIV